MLHDDNNDCYTRRFVEKQIALQQHIKEGEEAASIIINHCAWSDLDDFIGCGVVLPSLHSKFMIS